MYYLFSWRPKITYRGPITLSFKDKLLDFLIKLLDKEFKEKFPIVYLGFRPKNTFILHDSFSSPNSYNFKYLHMLRDKFKNIIEYL